MEYAPEGGEGPRSLQDRLRDIQGPPARARIAGATLTGYFQGAAARLGTGYPLDIYTLNRNGDTTVKEFANYLLKQWFHQLPPGTQGGQARVSDTFFHMYSMLVQPILPDWDTLRFMEVRRTA